MYLISGLGNPHSKFVGTRHNVGFMVADRLVTGTEGKFESICQSLVSKIRRCKRKVLIAKPQTYMNHSGTAIRALMDWHSLEHSELLVIYDDVDIPFGRIRLRERGGSGGHKGMNSIIAALGSKEFSRLRIGIGKSGPKSDLSSFVLDEFDQKERKLLNTILDSVVEIVDSILLHGMGKSMTNYNKLENTNLRLN